MTKYSITLESKSLLNSLKTWSEGKEDRYNVNIQRIVFSLPGKYDRAKEERCREGTRVRRNEYGCELQGQRTARKMLQTTLLTHF